jgi:hypothetical protein
MADKKGFQGWGTLLYVDLGILIISLISLIMFIIILRSYLNSDYDKIPTDEKIKSELSYGKNVSIGGVVFFVLAVLITFILLIIFSIFFAKSKSSEREALLSALANNFNPNKI